jgi:hypothetical protein
MHLTPVERLILLKLTQVLELIDPAHAAQHDADAQAIELGTPAGLAGLFDMIDLQPLPIRPQLPTLRLVTSEKECANV